MGRKITNMKILNWLKQRQHIIIAIILYFITFVTLYMIEFWIYEGAIDTYFLYLCIFPIACIIGQSNRDHNKPIEKAKKTVWSKIGIICYTILLILFALFFINVLYKNIYELVAYLYLELMFIITILSLSKKLRQFNTIFISIIYGTFLITILLYVIILNPFTVKEATVTVQNSGYTNVSYKNNIDNQEILSLILDTEIIESSKYEGNLGYYLFQGEQDEKDYFIVVSVTNGTIVALEEVTKNNPFEYLLD